MERLRLERARFVLYVPDLVLKHIDRLKETGVLQIEARAEARDQMFGKCTMAQFEAAKLATS